MNRQLLIAQLVAHEGKRLKPYTDTAGKLTIGVGRNLSDVGISNEESLVLLDTDIGRAVDGLITHVSAYTRLDDARQRVLVDMAFNLGIHGLLEFTHMLAAVDAGDFDAAADAMLASAWAQQVGQRAVDLAALMRSPVAG